MHRYTLTLSSVLVISTATGGLAQHAGDILLRSTSGQVETGLSDGVTTTFPNRVFADQFGKLGLPDRTTDPGVNSIPGAFPNNALVQLRVRRAARVWDAAAQNFCTIPSPPEAIQIRKGSNSANWIQTPETDPPDLAGPIINMGTTDPFDGLIHQHPVYWLLSPASDGVYLLELDVLTGGLAPSAPVWIVFDQNAPAQDVSDAIAFAEGTLAHGSGNLCRCRADFDDNQSVSVGDLFSFLGSWFEENGQTGAGLSADFDRSGGVSVNDLFAFLASWFAQC